MAHNQEVGQRTSTCFQGSKFMPIACDVFDLGSVHSTITPLLGARRLTVISVFCIAGSPC